jgi:hypothetical protein
VLAGEKDRGRLAVLIAVSVLFDQPETDHCGSRDGNRPQWDTGPAR